MAHHYIPLNFSEGPRPLLVDCVTERLCFGSVWFTFTPQTNSRSESNRLYILYFNDTPASHDRSQFVLCVGPFFLEVCLAVLNQPPEGNAFHHLHICSPPDPANFLSKCLLWLSPFSSTCNWHYSPHSIIIHSFKGNTCYFNLSSHCWERYQSVETELMTQDILMPWFIETGKLTLMLTFMFMFMFMLCFRISYRQAICSHVSNAQSLF